MNFATALLSIVLITHNFARRSVVFAQQSTTNITGCLTAYDPNIDYFPNKVVPTASTTWKIEYYNTYKILTNIPANETYLLYQCGTEIPISALEINDHAAVIEIPVKQVGIGVTTIIPQLEQLGVVDSIIAFTSDPTLISSPCLLSNIEEGNVIVLQSREELENVTLSPDLSEETLLRLQKTIGFIGDYVTGPPFQSSVKVSEYLETTNAGIFEWIKFFAAFYNLESVANDVFALTERRWDCVSEAAKVSSSTTADADQPIVYWMVYVAYCGGWDIGSCPNYYCEYAQQCSATLIETTIEGNYSDVCLANYLTIDQVVEIGKDADYWIYPAPDWNDTYTLFKEQLDTMKVVQNQHVYDYQGSGPLAWFETRSAEYFIVLQDFCSVVGTVTTPLQMNRTYFRNVFDGSPIGNIGTECTEGSRSNSILPVVGAVCDDLNLPALPPSAAPVTAPTDAAPIYITPTAPTVATTSSAKFLGNNAVSTVISVTIIALLF